MGAPVAIPDETLERVRPLCRALPEVTERVDETLSPARSTAYSFDVRRKSFCLLTATRTRSGRHSPLLVLRVDPEEREALLAVGPLFAPLAPAMTAS